MRDDSKSGRLNDIDALLPPQMAVKAEDIGTVKARMGWRNMLALSILAGAFIGLGAVFATTVTAGTAGMLPFGVVKLLGGVVFCLGLILVVIAGAELFTGNNLIVMAWADGRITLGQVARNWLIVYFGNFIGSIATALLMFLTKQYTFGGGSIGLNALNIANSKCGLEFMQAIALGIMCNALVCLAVWLCYSSRSNSDKILSILFPITAFVAAGFEHCIANMYFIPLGLFVKSGAGPVFWEAIHKTGFDFVNLTWSKFLWANLLPVTIGNIIGGAFMVGIVYWFVYIRKPRRSPFAAG